MSGPSAEAARASEPFDREQIERLESWTRRYPYPAMGLVEALRDVQRWHGRIRPEAEARLAELFRLPSNRVHEVATFYPYFTDRPAGRYRIEICRNLSCHLAGCVKMLEHLSRRLRIEEGEATPDGLFSFSAVECLGACEQAPALAVNDELLGPASAETLDRVVELCRAGEAPRAGTFPAAAPKPEWTRVGILTEHFHDGDLNRIRNYLGRGGYRAWDKARAMSPEALIAEVKKSNLRGLGGAGFPSGMKWSTVPPKAARQEPHYLVANADESEPGCFKDRVLMERNPHALLEGMLIAGRAVEADELFIFIRGEYANAYRVLEGAIREARAAGILARDILLMRGANAYISGCDTALMETMEGKKAWPRQPPPFPTVSGLMGHPTVVNNVETLMMVPAIIAGGGERFAGIGVPKSGGTGVYSVSGHVRRPGVYEFPMGTPFQDLLEAAGGLRPGRRLKAVIPGGTSTPVLTAEEAMAARMDFDGMRSLGSFLGAGGVVVLDDTADMAEVLFIIERFLHRESCGQCTPCREGSAWTERILARFLDGRGTADDLDTLLRVGDNITGKVICALGDTVGMVGRAMIGKFRGDFERLLARVPGGRASLP